MMQKNFLFMCIYTFLCSLPVWTQPPAGFVPPALHPAGARLETVPLGDGVYALVSDRPPVDNAGFVVGERGVLVIDAHIDEAMAGQILSAVRRVTDEPILYLVNTNYHADHTFGNHAFPDDTIVVAHRETRRVMEGFEEQKRRMLVTVDGDPEVFAGATLRLPDLVFDERVDIDLGGRRVELHYFGLGNTPGDTVVYEPVTGTAWTGNLVLGAGSLPFLLEGRPADYARTIRRFAETLPVRTLIPGHGAPAAAGVLERYVDYLDMLCAALEHARHESWSRERVLAVPLPARFAIDPELPSAPFYGGLHVFNLNRAYREPGR